MLTTTIKTDAVTLLSKRVSTLAGLVIYLLHNFRTAAELEDESDFTLADKFEVSGDKLRATVAKRLG